MSTSPESHDILTCFGCGAVIYEEHIHRGLAAYRDDHLLCPHCLAEYKKSEVAEMPSDQERVSLVDASEVGERPSLASIQTPGGPAVGTGPDFQRPLGPPDVPPTRIKIFHAKLSDGAVRHLETLVNEWIDGNPEVVVKHATTTVGQWEGKHAENHLIVTIYY